MARSSHSGQLNLLLPANLELTPCPLLSLVFDHGTGKPKGFGFCEYKDPETAASALRNLQGVEVGGRGLRLDFADTEDAPPSKRGPPGPGGLAGPGNIGRGGPGDVVPKPLPPGVNLPPGVSAVDSISQTLAAMPPGQLLDIMSQMKVRCGPSSCRGRGGEGADSTRGTQALVTTSPYDARALLQSNPQLSYALFQAMLMMNIVDPAILNVRLPTPPLLHHPSYPTPPLPQKMLPQTAPPPPSVHSPYGGPQSYGGPPTVHSPYGGSGGGNPSPSSYTGRQAPLSYPPQQPPPQGQGYGNYQGPPHLAAQPPKPAPASYGGPPPQAAPPVPPPQVAPEQAAVRYPFRLFLEKVLL